MTRYFGNAMRGLVAALAMGFMGVAAAQTVGNTCVGNGCRGQDANTVGGGCIGHYCGAGFANNTGGDCLGTGCQAGNGKTGGGTCYGDGCKAGNAWTAGGDCYGAGCTPGKGGTVSGRAFPFNHNTNCMVGEALQNPQRFSGWGPSIHLNSFGNSRTAPKAACEWNVTAAVPPSPPLVVTITALPPNPWAPENLPKCPYTCQAYNPASGSCVGAPMNGC
jgi:hypothetical protein